MEWEREMETGPLRNTLWPATWLCLGLGLAYILTLAFAAVMARRPNAPVRSAIDDDFSEISAEMLGDYLGERFSGGRIAVIKGVPDRYNDRNAARTVLGLVKGIGRRASVTRTVSSPVSQCAIDAFREDYPDWPENSDPIPIQFWFNAQWMDRAIEECGDCDLIVSLVGLPDDALDMKIWKSPARPKLALLTGSPLRLQKLIADASIAALVSNRPVDFATLPEPDPQNLSLAWPKRYVVVAPDNVQKVLQEYPGAEPSTE